MTASDPAGTAMWATVWKLLRLRLRININSFRHSRTRIKIFTTLGLLGLLSFAVVIFLLSWEMLRFLRSPQLSRYTTIDSAALLQAITPLVMTGLFFGILFTSFGVLLQALYLAGDMDFLLAAPVPMRAVFISKLTQAILPNLGLFALFGLPVLYGLGASEGYNFLYYPLVLVVISALTFAAAGAAALLVMAVVRIMRPRRAAEILGFIGATAGIICSQLGNLSQTLGHRAGNPPALLGGASFVALRLETPWLPLNWAGQSLMDLGAGQWLSGLLLLALTIGWTSGLFWLSLVFAERLYYAGWAGMQVVMRRSGKLAVGSRFRGAEGNLSWPERFLAAPIRAIMQKDFTLLRRDLRNLTQLISPLIIGAALTFSFLRRGAGAFTGGTELPSAFMQSFQPFFSFENAAIALFVGWLLLGRMAGMSFSREGRNFWVLKASPISPRQLLAAKFLGAYLPGICAGYLFLIATSLVHRPLPGQLLFMAVVIGASLAALNSILISFGVAGANFTWDDPRRMNAGGIGCLGQIVSLLFLPFSLLLFGGPVLMAVFLNLPPGYGYAAGLLLGVSGSLAGMLVPLLLVQSRVQRLDES